MKAGAGAMLPRIQMKERYCWAPGAARAPPIDDGIVVGWSWSRLKTNTKEIFCIAPPGFG